MILTADYHTHTVFSHGKGDILENAQKAREMGLKEIGITDHGFAHPFFGLSQRKVDKMSEIIKKENEKGDLRVVLGIESNITGIDGSVDLKPKNYDKFNLFLAGMHKMILYKFGSVFSLSIPNLTRTYVFKKHVPNRVIKNNTKAFINVIKNNPIDAITHLNFCCFADSLEVAKVASDYGTYIELNSKKTHLTDEEIINILAKTDARFIINSDAHSPERVGEISLVSEMINRLDFPLDRIDNIDGKTPSFRFEKFKSEAGR